ncbi:MAG: hypothetical protein IRZ32_06360 [Solirubrobacteraceae bacterium]|nr:hypothetical protein [Solirubrobacteraceae bacterium]
MFESRGETIADAVDTELAAVARLEVEPAETPLRAVAQIARAAGGLDPAGGDVLRARRHRAALRQVAAAAARAAAAAHGPFGVLAEAGARARDRGRAPGVMRALGAVASAALALPPIPEDGNADWQLGAIAFVDEPPLRALYAAYVELVAAALAELSGAG